MKSFVHLHLHSQYSLLDSSLKINRLLEEAQQQQMPSVALTDHGTMLGALEFYKTFRRSDVKPIFGSELYLASGSRLEKPQRSADQENYFHLTCLIKSRQGYQNICQLISRSFLEGFYYRPRIDKELLEKYSAGLIILSGCLQGELSYYFLRDQPERAYQEAKWYREVFKDDFFIEIQNHYLPEQIKILPQLIRLAQELSIPLVATNDVHYLKQEESKTREVLLCLQTNEQLANQDREFKSETDQMFFKSSQQMRDLFQDIPEACDNTIDIAARCNFEFELGKHWLPVYAVPEKVSVDDYFATICRSGFEKLREEYFPGKKLRHSLADYEQRLNYEIEKIREMGFAGYFLIVWDIIHFARRNGILVGPGRGSVVGSLVAFAMGITRIDPLEYDLIFERFLNPERISLPDIDIDFDADRRDEVISYIREKYGKDNVCQIVTFNRMKAKMAIRDVSRVLGVSLSEADRVAKMIPNGPKIELEKELKENIELQKEVKNKKEIAQVIEYALSLENTTRNPSKHAAGVVIAPAPITEFMPLYRVGEEITTHFEKEEVEEIGLLKMDILGLKTLSIIRIILEDLRQKQNVEIDLEKIPLNDQKTFKIFQKADTNGIFQFESSGMKDLLKRAKPACLEDLTALNALYRPGPLNAGMVDSYVSRKLGKEKVSYRFAELEEILKGTYGIIVFQEQVMQIAVKIAGFSMSEADELRKIMGKKKTEKMPEQETKFIERGLKRGHSRKQLEELFQQMKTFAEYGFNKSHSAAYAYLAYQTAYLKAHYPVFFIAANLSSEAGKTSTVSKMIQYISEARQKGIEILPPDINRSELNFSVEDTKKIRFGLLGLKGVGEKAIEAIISARRTAGGFKSFNHFLEQIDLQKVNKAVLESLIKAGAFDCFQVKRRQLFENLTGLLERFSRRENNHKGRKLFEFDALQGIDFISGEEWNEEEMIKGEKQVTGLYLRSNPLEKYLQDIELLGNVRVAELEESKKNKVKIVGVITEIKEKKSRKGEFYGDLAFEDLTGSIAVRVFKERWQVLKDSLKTDRPVLLEGSILNEDYSTIIADQIEFLEEALKKKIRLIKIILNYQQLSSAFNEQLSQKLEQFKDSVPFRIEVIDADGRKIRISPGKPSGLKPTHQMKRELEKLVGENRVELIL